MICGDCDNESISPTVMLCQECLSKISLDNIVIEAVLG